MASSITKFRFQSPSNQTVENARRNGTARHVKTLEFEEPFVIIALLVDCRLLFAVMKTMIAFWTMSRRLSWFVPLVGGEGFGVAGSAKSRVLKT
jgi:hypothetical protein